MLKNTPACKLTSGSRRLNQPYISKGIPFGFLEDAVHYRNFYLPPPVGRDPGRSSFSKTGTGILTVHLQLLRSKTIPRHTVNRYFVYVGNHHDQDQRNTT